VEWRSLQPVLDGIYHAGPRSVVVLASGAAFESEHDR